MVQRSTIGKAERGTATPNKSPTPRNGLSDLRTMGLAYLLLLLGMFAGSVVFWLLNEGGVFLFSKLTDVLLMILMLPIVVGLFCPIVVALVLGIPLLGEGSDVLGFLFLLAICVFQDLVLIRAVRRLFWTGDSWQRWVWRTYLFAYSAVALYVLLRIVVSHG